METEQTVPLPAGNASLSRRIAAARALAGFTQTALADRIGVSRVKVNLWENERRTPDAEEVRRVATETGVTVAWLYGEDAS